MKTTTTYSVGEFARLAGVTVRTLHYYDEAGLLKPARRTEGQHRLYKQSDLLRLQQILTLKYLGFSLQEIESLLESPIYNVRRSLQIQKDAVYDRIRQMQGVALALTRTLEALDTKDALDWEQVIAVIQGLGDARTEALYQRYYTPEQIDWLNERGAATPPALMEKAAQAWKQLYADFAALQHLPPEHPDVQVLAGQMQQLGEMFTGGDPEIEASLTQLYSDTSQIPDTWRVPGYTPELQAFMMAALRIYRKGK